MKPSIWIPYFGNSSKEQDLFTPKEQTIISSINFGKGVISIAKYAGSNNTRINKLILKDISNNSYPIISIKSGKIIHL